MNRDDVATRPEAPPAFWPNSNPTFVAPKDLQAGGTWMGVNEHGVTACLLNRYDEAPAGRRSRGGIVVEALHGACVDATVRRLTALELSAFSPFTCVLVSMHNGIRLDWTGTRLERAPLHVNQSIMLTSSSWRFSEVTERREALFRQIWAHDRSSEENLDDFHCNSDSKNESWAPMMRRASSETKSITQVELNERFVEMRYWTRRSALARALKHPDASVQLPVNANTATQAVA